MWRRGRARTDEEKSPKTRKQRTGVRALPGPAQKSPCATSGPNEAAAGFPRPQPLAHLSHVCLGPPGKEAAVPSPFQEGPSHRRWAPFLPEGPLHSHVEWLFLSLLQYAKDCRQAPTLRDLSLHLGGRARPRTVQTGCYR